MVRGWSGSGWQIKRMFDNAVKHAMRRIFIWLVGYPSGQRGQTVNLLAYAFDGSNPSPTTIFFFEGKQGFYPLFTMVCARSVLFVECAFVLLPSFGDFSKTMREK